MFVRIPFAALLGIFFTGLFFFVAIFAPLIAPFGYDEVVSQGFWDPPTSEFLLGTDGIGRDLLSRMIYGLRTTIWIATLATILSFTLGSVLGFLAAVVGGWVDQALSRLVDLLMSIPSLIFALVFLSITPITVAVLILVMGFLDSTRVYRLARAVAVAITVMAMSKRHVCAARKPAGSYSVKSSQTRSRHWLPKWGYGSSSRCSSFPLCPSSVSAFNHRRLTSEGL